MERTIILILNYPADRQESMVRFGGTMHRLLLGTGAPIITWCPPYFWGKLAAAGPRWGAKWLAYADKFGLGALSLLWLRLRRPGVIWHIVDHSNAIYAGLLPAGRVIITCHDCIAIEDALFGRTGQAVGRLGPLFQRWISRGLRRAGAVVCVSKATANDLARLVHPNPRRVRVVYNGMIQQLTVPEHAEAMDLLKKHGIECDRPFIFMIGSDLRRKNRHNVIKCFDLLRANSETPDFQLVVAGKPMQGENRTAADASPWRHDIVEMGNIDSATLAAAYRYASVVLFPSLAEGFGLPILEAQSCGAALVTSRRLPMSELAGDGAVLVNPEDPEDIAAGVLQAHAESNALRQRGLLNARRFDPDKMLKGYLDTYRFLECRRHKECA